LWGLQGGNLETAQKTNIGGSSFRAVPDNTGWIGSNFLTSPAIVCGSSNTPFQTVASPGGTIFAAANQAAGKELAVKPGQSVQLVVSGNPGDGWPHPRGHVQTYLADCGGSCTNFDASKGKFFKIQSEVNGIQNTLKPAYDGGVDGNRYNVKIPTTIPDGHYIFRFELIAFGQSGASEGGQDQYYPFCGQINVSGGSSRLSTASLATVTFPGAYKNGNRDQNSVPGPAVLAGGATTIGGNTGKTASSSSSSSSTGTKGSVSTSSSSSSLTLASGAPSCASMCLGVKLGQLGDLAPSCAEDDGACLCAQKDSFVQAFYNCARDNCDGGEAEANAAFDDACAAVGGSAAGSAVDEEEEGDCAADDDEDEELTKRQLVEVEAKLAKLAKEKLRRRSLSERSAAPVELAKKAAIVEELLTREEYAKRYPAPPHAVIRPVVRRSPPAVVVERQQPKEDARERRSKTHGLNRAAHGKRFARERRAKVAGKA